jgi:hypothetical protein
MGGLARSNKPIANNLCPTSSDSSGSNTLHVLFDVTDFHG